MQSKETEAFHDGGLLFLSEDWFGAAIPPTLTKSAFFDTLIQNAVFYPRILFAVY